jgi:hypothetical protein
MLASYAKGSATVKVTRGSEQETVELDRVGPGSSLTSMIGADATWRNDDGWIVHVSAFGAGGTAPVPGPVMSQVGLQLISDGEVWATQGVVDDRCIVTTAEVSEKRIAGDAICKGLRWVDAIAAQGAGAFMGEPPYIKDEEPFDAVISFEATP